MTRLMTTDRPNWQDWGGRWGRRTAFMRNLKTILEELDIRYTMPVQPVLLPSHPPPGWGGGGGPMSPTPRLQMPVPRDLLGNAGSFQGSQHLRAPLQTFGSLS